jgi:hypothetical protein
MGSKVKSKILAWSDNYRYEITWLKLTGPDASVVLLASLLPLWYAYTTPVYDEVRYR